MSTNQDQTEAVSEAIKIFLCHSWDDKAAVRDLYQRLRHDGFRPWLDERELLPGQDWEQETKVALRNSNAVIVCLSRHSVTKRGYAQKEIKRALDLAEEQPLGNIFLIPLRLEPCDIPDQLRKWQCVDYFEEDGYEKLRRTLDLGRSTKVAAGPSIQSSSAMAHPPVGNRAPSTKPNPLPQIVPFALISLVSFLLGAILLFFMVWKAEKLVALGLTGRLYYIVLLPLGLSVAGFLFGVLQSFATYHGQQLRGTLTLGGPIIAFLLVMVLGFGLVPDPSTFPLTVYVHGPGGMHDIVLRNSGEVFMDLGSDRRHVPIGEQGQAYFPAIPANFRGQEVPVWVASDKFESLETDKRWKLDGSSLYVPVLRIAGHIYGHVQSQDPSCMAGAQIRVAGLSVPVDEQSGYFHLTIHGELLSEDLSLKAVGPGCVSENYNVVPNSNEVTITLRKSNN